MHTTWSLWSKEDAIEMILTRLTGAIKLEVMGKRVAAKEGAALWKVSGRLE